jgi:hypothetical protein
MPPPHDDRAAEDMLDDIDRQRDDLGLAKRVD